MKECCKCKQSFNENEFPPMGKRKSSYCRSCKQEYQKIKYQERKEEILQKKKISQKLLKEHYYEIINKIKDVPCKDCGGRFPPICMDFDHLPGTEKIDNISCLLRYSLYQALEEIKKCEIVCANCHRIRTLNRNQQGVR